MFDIQAIKLISDRLWINVREYRRGHQNRTIQRNWQHRVHKTTKNKAKTQNNMCWTSLCAYTNTNNVNKTLTLLNLFILTKGFMVLDRHNYVVGLNGLIRSPPSPTILHAYCTTRSTLLHTKRRNDNVFVSHIHLMQRFNQNQLRAITLCAWRNRIYIYVMSWCMN